MRSKSRHSGGFTLLEMMIALFVGALLILVSYNVLVNQRKASDAQNQFVSAQQNARVALETLEKELRLAGLNIDDFDHQPVFVDAAPYQVIFNADISTGVMGVLSMSISQTVPLHDGTIYSPGDFPDENIGSLTRYNNNAETIRYTLDRDDNGVVNAADRYAETDNPSDYALMREENGTRIDMIAYGLRGRETYPDGQFPAPLFKYYGDFVGNGTIRLWGDTDLNGQLSQAEIAAITAVPQNLLDKIIEVEISVEAESATLEANYAGPHSTSGVKRHFRSVVMSSKIRPRNVGTGDANLHACGDPPMSPTSLTAYDTPDDAGESITLGFNASFDEGSGEDDIDNYTIYRRKDTESEWTCIGSVTPAGLSSYAFDDDIHTPAGGPEMGIKYYYEVTAWDCRPQESSPSNIIGPVWATANGPEPPAVINAFDTPCDAIDEVTVVVRRSTDDTGSGGTVASYRLYRGTVEGGGILSKTYIGSITADGSATYTFLDNQTNNVALAPPYPGSMYYYMARSVSTDTVPSINSNEYGGVYYSGTISSCNLVGVEDFPDDEGDALTVRWTASPSETCVPSEIAYYEVKRKSVFEPAYAVIQTIAATGAPSYAIVDGGLTRGAKYTYCIWTSDGTTSVPSNEKSAVPVRNTGLDPPQNLVAEDILCEATGAVNVTWERAPEDVPVNGIVTHYRIYRHQESTSPVEIAAVEATGDETYAFVDNVSSNPTSPPVIGEFYYYSATSYDDDTSRESAPSDESYTMSDGEPGAPRITGAYDTPMDEGRSITIVWDRSADDGHCTSNVIIYKIYRETSALGGFSNLVGELTANGSLYYSFYDDETNSLDPPFNGVGYYYTVRASDGTKESVNSNIAGPIYAISQDPASYIVFQDDFETNKGWTHGYARGSDDWMRGDPTGEGGTYGNRDPANAHAGSNCWGNDIGTSTADGLYPNNVENYLTTPSGAINCTGHANVVIQFWRWLNVEAPAYDQARIYVSTSGTSGPWTQVWQNPTQITDNAWVFVEVDVSEYVDDESNVAFRFFMKSDGQHQYTGWNIDDFVVREKPNFP